MQQIVGILPGGVEADEEVSIAVSRNDVLQTRAELGIACGGFDELQLGGGLLKIVAQEGGVVPIARGVDADADRWEMGISQLHSGSGLW